MPLLGPVHVYLLSVTQSRLHVYQHYMSRSSCIPASTVLAIPPSAAMKIPLLSASYLCDGPWAQSQVLSVGDQRAIAGRIHMRGKSGRRRQWGPRLGPQEGGGVHTPFVSLSAGGGVAVRRPRPGVRPNSHNARLSMVTSVSVQVRAFPLELACEL